jgi:hypothetical protein
MICWLRDCHIHLCLAVSLTTQAVFFSAVPAAAEPGGFSAEQRGAGQSQSDSEQDIMAGTSRALRISWTYDSNTERPGGQTLESTKRECCCG